MTLEEKAGQLQLMASAWGGGTALSLNPPGNGSDFHIDPKAFSRVQRDRRFVSEALAVKVDLRPQLATLLFARWTYRWRFHHVAGGALRSAIAPKKNPHRFR